MLITQPAVKLPNDLETANHVKYSDQSTNGDNYQKYAEKQKYLDALVKYIEIDEKLTTLVSQQQLDEGASNSAGNDLAALRQSRSEALQDMITMAQQGSPDAVDFIVQLKIFAPDENISEHIDKEIDNIIRSQPGLVAIIAKNATLITLSPSESNKSGSVEPTLHATVVAINERENGVNRYRLEIKRPLGGDLNAPFEPVLLIPENTLKAALLWKSAAEYEARSALQSSTDYNLKQKEELEAIEAVKGAEEAVKNAYHNKAIRESYRPIDDLDHVRSNELAELDALFVLPPASVELAELNQRSSLVANLGAPEEPEEEFRAFEDRIRLMRSQEHTSVASRVNSD